MVNATMELLKQKDENPSGIKKYKFIEMKQEENGGVAYVLPSPDKLPLFKVSELNLLHSEMVDSGALSEPIEGWNDMVSKSKKAALTEFFESNMEEHDPVKKDLMNILEEELAKEEAKMEEDVVEEAQAKEEVEDLSVADVLETTLESNELTVVDTTDEISVIAGEVESISSLKDLKAMVGNLIEGMGLDQFRLGGCLARAQTSPEWWHGEHPTFAEFVEVSFGIKYRRAMYYIEIYNGLLASGVPWSKVKDLGWTKVIKLLSVLTAENADEWVNKAKEMKVLHLEAEIKAHNEGLDTTQIPVLGLTMKTFKLHEDQKHTIQAALEKAKKQTGSSADTVALEHICMEHLGASPEPADSQSASPLINQDGVTVDMYKKAFKASLEQAEGNEVKAIENIFEAFEEVFPNVSIVVDFNK